MSSLRYRIGVVKEANEKTLAHFHKSVIVIASKEVKFKKFGLSIVSSVAEEYGFHKLYRIGAHVFWGKDQKKIFSEIKENKHQFSIVFLPQAVAEEHKSFLKSYKGKVHVEVVSEGIKAVDVGLGKWIRSVDDVDSPLYDNHIRTSSKSTSHPSPKKDDTDVKIVAKESAQPKHTKPGKEKAEPRKDVPPEKAASEPHKK